MIAARGYSQIKNFRFSHYTSDNGLSANDVYDLIQDSKGFIWVATQDGLNRFDGTNFVVFKKNLKQNSISDNYIWTLMEDSKGDLYIGTDAGGLSIYNPVKNSFTNFLHSGKDSTSIGSNEVSSLYEDSAGNLWVGTDGGGLNLFNRRNKKFTRFTSDNNKKTKLLNNVVRSMAEDDAGNLWVGTEGGGVSILNINTKQFIKNYTFENESLSANNVSKIFKDSRNNIWIGTKKNGLNLYNAKTNTFKIYSDRGNSETSITGSEIKDIAEDKDGKMLFATNKGINVFDTKASRFTYLHHESNNPHSLLSYFVTSVYTDRQGSVWIGSAAGIDREDPGNPKFLHFTNSVTNPKSMAGNEASVSYQDKRGNIWVSTNDSFDLFDLASGTFTHYKNKVAIPQGFSSMYEDRKNRLWISTWEGFYLFDRDNLKVQRLSHADPNNTKSARIAGVLGIDEDLDGNIWLGVNNAGIFRFVPEEKRFYAYNYPGKHIPDYDIFTFRIDSSGNFWVGTALDGVYLFNKQAGLYRHFKHNENDSRSLIDNSIRDINIDKNGRICIGTKGGLSLYNKATGDFTNYAESKGLLNSNIKQIRSDKNNNLWISTGKGLFKFDPRSQTFKIYTVEDNLQGNEFAWWSSGETKSGEMLFGGPNGLNVFHPDSVKENKTPPPVLITGFQIFNKPVEVADKNSPLKVSVDEANEIVLSYKQNVFSFQFSALNYIAGNKNKYAYKMVGFDKDWIYTGAERKANYTNLDPGEYTFRVKASNNDGIWNEKGTSIKVIITPPFWATWWFRTLVVSVVAGSAISFYRYRMSRIKAQKAELERLVTLRTQEVVQKSKELEAQAEEMKVQSENLQAANEELQSQSEELQVQSENLQSVNEELQVQSEELQAHTETLEVLNKELDEERKKADKANEAKSVFLATMSHEIRTPMNGVIGMASLLAETELNNEQEDYVKTIRVSGDALLAVINDILDFSKIESGNMELEHHDFDLRKCIEDVMDLFAGKAAEQGLDLVYQIDHTVPPQIMGDGLRLRQIIINLISNALKFTHKGEVFVKVVLTKAVKDDLELTFDIKDTGIGIPKEKLTRLFKAFSQVDSSTTRKYGGTGLGLVISERLVKLMGGTIWVASEEGQGTTFSFNIQTKAGQESKKQYANVNFEANNGKQVLVVDDNMTNLEILRAQLEQWKLIPTLAQSGKQALEILKGEKVFDLVITDMQMPEMDGIEVATEIKKRQPKLPIMLLSSVGDETRSKYPHLFSAVLTKPIKQAQLYKLVQQELKEQGSSQTQVEQKKQSILSEDFAKAFPLNILLAEDNLINQKLATRVLNKLGFEIEIAGNGRQAVDMLNEKAYDVILMDVLMPEMDGLEATRYIRKNSTHQPIIVAMTANALPEDREECIKAGMNDYISKPINLEILVRILQETAEKV